MIKSVITDQIINFNHKKYQTMKVNTDLSKCSHNELTFLFHNDQESDIAYKDLFIWQVHYLWYLIPWDTCDHVTFANATY
jgi:hypothetical protein